MSANNDDYDRAATLFKEALEQPPGCREAFINSVAGHDASLANRVRRMISYIENSDAVDMACDVAAVNVESTSTDPLINADIGPFRIRALIGQGGFGMVYRAEQEQPVRRVVAMKILSSWATTRPGRDASQVVTRFEAERQALALMEHPNIARVLDAGQTTALHGSRPYIVMEFINGEPITAYCDRHRLGIRERLELFVTVCQAVQHAHQRGIIHRDLKPSNILVTEIDAAPTPKIIDFGIAKAVAEGQRLTETDLVTNRMELLGTPQYMSPEQADADERSIDTRSDVYSLGVVLYELLTGTTPLDPTLLRSSSYSRMLRMIMEQRFQSPSARIASQGEASRDAARERGHVDVSTLARQLRGELDWITAKALDSDRSHRYDSAAALAEDINRYLSHRAVVAGPPGAMYRARTFVRRHRVSVIGAAVVALALLVGSIMAIAGMIQARRAADESLQINQFMSDVLMSPDPNVGGAEIRLAEALTHASSTASTRFAGHPAVEARVHDMLGRVFNNITMFAESTAEYQRAAEIWTSLGGPDDPRALESHVMRVRALSNANRIRESHEATIDLAPRVNRVLGPDHRIALELQRFIGLNQTYLGHADDGERILRVALNRARQVKADERVIFGLLDALVRNLMYALRFTDAERTKALATDLEDLARDLLAQSEQLFDPESPQALRAKLAIAQAVSHRADFRQAADVCRSILAVSASRLGACHGVRTDAMFMLARSLYRLNEAPEAAEIMLQEVQCNRTASNPLIVIGHLYESMPFLDYGGKWSVGEAIARETSEILRQYGGGHDGMQIGADTQVARFVSLQGRLDEADELFADVISRLEAGEVDEHPNLIARVKLQYASHLVKRQRFEDAETQLLEAVNIQGDPTNGTWDTVPDDLLNELISLYEAWGKPEQARKYQGMREHALRQPTF